MDGCGSLGVGNQENELAIPNGRQAVGESSRQAQKIIFRAWMFSAEKALTFLRKVFYFFPNLSQNRVRAATKHSQVLSPGPLHFLPLGFEWASANAILRRHSLASPQLIPPGTKKEGETNGIALLRTEF
ncbi:MAG TPA: hypothetical protein VHS96_07545 [Bacteroidia bacterium]|nr:hypothetical protein [Bacteroidia bacterium]